MAIQWFPGHMHLTRKAIGERIKEIDVVIEMLDARLPGSSANPMLAELIKTKPALKVLSKQDLADPERTALWLAHYNAMPGVRAIGLDTSMTSPAKALIDNCQQLAPNRGGMVKPMRVLICGIPNVGKSTLINTLKGKRAAKTGDEAGVTKTEQRIALADDFYLYDTPGVLWPRIIVEQSGFNLAASGAIGVNAFDEETVALELLHYLIPHYPNELHKRYNIDNVANHTDEEMLEAIGRKRGAVQSGGRINLTKAAHIVIHDFRTAALGRITLETPAQFATWLAEGKQADAERAVRKEAIEKNKKKSCAHLKSVETHHHMTQRRDTPDKEAIALLPEFPRLGLDRITLVNTGKQAQLAHDALIASRAWGFDTESKPTFRVGEASDGPHILQLATGERAWVFQLHDPECRAVAADLLAHPGIAKAGFGLGDDRKRIIQKLGVEPAGILELNTLFKAQGYRKEMGVKGAVAVLFNQRFQKSKKAATSNWANLRLSESQLIYAANDAYAAYRVWEALKL